MHAGGNIGKRFKTAEQIGETEQKKSKRGGNWVAKMAVHDEQQFAPSPNYKAGKRREEKKRNAHAHLSETALGVVIGAMGVFGGLFRKERAVKGPGGEDKKGFM